MKLKGAELLPAYVDVIKSKLIEKDYRVEQSDDYFTTYYLDIIIHRTKTENMAWLYAEMHKTLKENQNEQL